MSCMAEEAPHHGSSLSPAETVRPRSWPLQEMGPRDFSSLGVQKGGGSQPRYAAIFDRRRNRHRPSGPAFAPSREPRFSRTTPVSCKTPRDKSKTPDSFYSAHETVLSVSKCFLNFPFPCIKTSISFHTIQFQVFSPCLQPCFENWR